MRHIGFKLLIAFWCATGSNPLSAQALSEPELRERFRAQLDATFAEMSVAPPPQARRELETLIDDGVATLVAEGATDLKADQAAANLDLLARALISLKRTAAVDVQDGQRVVRLEKPNDDDLAALAATARSPTSPAARPTAPPRQQFATIGEEGRRNDVLAALGIGSGTLLLMRRTPNARYAVESPRRTPVPAAEIPRRVPIPAVRLPGITREIQAALNALGYEAGPPDGIAGARTRDAIGAYQADRGLPVSGRLTEPEIAALLARGRATLATPAAPALAPAAAPPPAAADPPDLGEAAEFTGMQELVYTPQGAENDLGSDVLEWLFSIRSLCPPPALYPWCA